MFLTLRPTDELIKKAQENDLEAFGELVALYQDRVYTHCMHLAHDVHDAHDLAQDVFVQAFKNIKSFRSDADFGTWLHRIAVNLWINQVRRNRKAAAFSLDEPLLTGEGELSREVAACEESPEEWVERREFQETIKNALNRLQPEYRVALILRELEGYSYEEIAGIMGCSLGTVKSRINRGRKALKKELGKFRL